MYIIQVNKKSFNPHTPDVWESLILRGGGKYAPQGKLAIFAIFLHFRQQKRHQGTLGKQRWTLIESRTSHGPSMDPTGPLKWTSWFSRKIQAKIPFVHYTLSSPSKHFGTLFLVIVELYQGPEDPPGPSWTPKWTPKWILRGKFWRTVGKKGPSRAPSWSKVINFFR